MSTRHLRIFIGVFLITSLFVAPFWISGLIALASLVLIPYYFEAVLFFICVDLLYYGGGVGSLRYWYPFGIAFAFVLIEVMRGFLRERRLTR